MAQIIVDTFADIPTGEDMAEDMLLVFSIAGQSYAIDIRNVTEIIELLPIYPVPNMPACLKGVINLRGAVVPVIDVRLRFGLSPQDYTARTCIIVVEHGGMSLGLIVDAVQEMMTVPEQERMPSPVSPTENPARYIRGMTSVGGQIQLLLDCEKLMDIVSCA